MDSKYMKLAIEEAKKSKDSDGYWIGAIIVKNNEILSQAYSDEKNNKGHGQIITRDIYNDFYWWIGC